MTHSSVTVAAMDAFKELDVLQLKEYLKAKKISSKTLESLACNMISGLALSLISEEEMKEVVPMLGDRILVKNIIRNLDQVRHAHHYYI